jgi:hypothetical protein
MTTGGITEKRIKAARTTLPEEDLRIAGCSEKNPRGKLASSFESTRQHQLAKSFQKSDHEVIRSD